MNLQQLWNSSRAVLDEDVSRRKLPFGRRAWATVLLTFEQMNRTDTFVRAAAISYSMVFTLAPLVATTIAFITAFPGLREQRNRITSWIFSQLVPGALDTVRTFLTELFDRAAAAGAVSSLTFLVFVLLLFQSIEHSCNIIWNIEKQRTWPERVRALGLTLFFAAVLVTGVVVLESSVPWQLAEGLWWQILTQVAEVVASVVAYTLLIKLLPNARVKWVPALIGGALAGVVWYGLKSIFSWYITNVANYQNLYGALGTIPAFFLWVYLSAMFLLIGSQVAFVVQNFRALMLRRQTRGGSPPTAFHATATAVVLHLAFRRGEGPLSSAEISERLNVAPYFVTEAVTALNSAGLLLAVPDSEATHRYSLNRPASSISVHDIVLATSGEILALPRNAAEPGPPFVGAIERLFSRAQHQDVLNRTSIEAVADGVEAAAEDGRPGPIIAERVEPKA